MTARRLPALATALLLGLLGCSPAGEDTDALPPPDAVVPTVSPEIDGRITINELMAANALTAVDDSGAAGDWIELYNPTEEDIPLHGYALTDDLARPLHAVLPASVVVPAGGYLLLWADGEPSAGPNHLRFRLAEEGGDVALARPDGSFIDRVSYGAQEVDFSAAREPDGSDLWQIEWQASPGAANPDGDGQPGGFDVAAEPPEPIPAAGDLSEQILDYDLIPELGLVVSAASAASLEVDPFTYVPADLMFHGRSYGPVGIRLKGVNSFQPFSEKPSLRINVDEYVDGARFFGLKDMTLNNMDNDFSMMHERLAYWVARSVGVPASRANHALLTVNGQFYGLYTNVETVKRHMIERWFEDTSGPLFEATDVDFAAAYIPDYELESGPDDRSLLSGLAAALTIASADEAIAAAGAYADLRQFRRFWALCSVIGQFDSFPYSNPGDDYFVYGDPVRTLTFLPWGMDETFYSALHDVTQTQSVLAEKCKASPACFQDYVDQTWEILAITETIDLAGERNRIIAQIAPYVTLDQRKWYTDEEVAAYQSALFWFINDRRVDLETMLPPRP